MKKWILAILLLLGGSISFAQTATVSATVVDSDSTAWANGTWNLQFLPNNDNPNINIYNQNGVPLLPTVMFQSGTLNSGGAFSFSAYVNPTITPLGSSWKVTVCPHASAPCGSYIFTISSTSPLDISSALTAVIPAPRFQARSGTYGYIDAEATLSISTGATYWNVTTTAQRCYTGSVWGNCGSGGSGNPAGSTQQVQWNNSGAFGASSAFTFNPVSSVTYAANMTAQLGYGSGYAAQYQTGGGNNGIANCFLAGINRCIADPSYGSTENPSGPASTIFSKVNANYVDYRSGGTLNYYRNPAMDSSGNIPFINWFGSYGEWGQNINCQYDITFNNSTGGNVRPNCLELFMTQINPGLSLGNPAVGPGGWQTSTESRLVHQVASSGVAVMNSDTQFKTGMGDNILFETYLQSSNGYISPSDEGTKALSYIVTEDNYEYAGYATGGPYSSPTKITTNQLENGGQQGNNRYIVDIGQCGTNGSTYPPTYPAQCNAAPYTGAVTNIGLGLNNIGSTITTSGTVPVSNAWGRLVSNVATPVNTQPPFSTSETISVTIQSGTFDATHLVCFDSQFHDCSIPTAVGTPSGGVQTVTLPLRHAHASGSHAYQGGLAGYGLEMVAYTNTSLVQPLRFLWDVFGSTGANTIQAGTFQAGSTIAVSFPNPSQSFIFQTFNLATNLSSSGTTVTGTYTGIGSLPQPPNTTQNGTIYISNTDSGAIDGTCTNTVWTTLTAFTCTNASLTGTHTNVTNTPVAQMANQFGVNLNKYNLWPMAEVLDVRNTSINPPILDGTLTLEPNALGTIANGDVIEETHHIAARIGGSTPVVGSFDPFSFQSYSEIASLGGYGASGGGIGSSAKAFKAYIIGSADSIYSGTSGGGFLNPINWMNFIGPYFEGLNFDHGPVFGQASLLIKPSSAQRLDPLYSYNIFQTLNNDLTYNTLSHAPNSGNQIWKASGTIQINAPTMDLSIISKLLTPSFTLNTDGGFVSGKVLNYAPYSNQLNGATWQTTGGSGTVTTCSITDDEGNPACTLTAGGAWNYDDNNTSSYTALPASTASCVQMRLVGASGGESVTIASNFLTTGHITLTTTPQNYTFTFTSATSGIALKNFAGIHFLAAGTVTVSNVVSRPGTCGPPARTTNTQILTPTTVNNTTSLALNGNAIGSPGGFPGPLDGSGKVPASQIPGGGGGGGISNIQITTGTSLISANTCTTNTASSMTGVTTASAIIPPTPTSSTVGVTGWDGANPALSFSYYVTSNTFNWSVCNGTAAAITPGGSITWNVGAF